MVLYSNDRKPPPPALPGLFAAAPELLQQTDLGGGYIVSTPATMVLPCPDGFLLVGYQARAYEGGIDYLDVSLRHIPPSHSSPNLWQAFISLDSWTVW